MQGKKEAKVKVQNLTKKFGDLLVLDDLNFEVQDGEFLCIVGPTGCGKTTFLNTLTKLYVPTAGETVSRSIRKNRIYRIYSRSILHTHG